MSSTRSNDVLKGIYDDMDKQPKKHLDALDNTEDKLLQAIMNKMNVRLTDVSVKREVHFQEPKVRVACPKTSVQPRLEKPMPLSEKIPLFESLKKSPRDLEYITQSLAEMFATRAGRIPGNIEVEASFGLFEGNAFRPGLRSHTDFTNLTSFLNSCESPAFQSHNLEDVIETMKVDGDNIRRRFDVDNPDIIDFERKIRYTKSGIVLPEFGVRVTRSTETSADEPSEWFPTLRRKRKRQTFFTVDHKSPFVGFMIDLTIVQEEEIEWHKNANNVLEEKPGVPRVKYEVEIERNNRTKQTQTGVVSNFLKLVDFVYRASIYNGRSLSNSDLFFNMSERAYCVKLHNTLFEGDIRAGGSKYPETGLYQFFGKTYWNKPRNIKLRDLQPGQDKRGNSTFNIKKALPTVKLNGRRFFLLCATNACYLIMPPYTMVRFGVLAEESSRFDGTYLDGELVAVEGSETYTFHAFDVLFFKGRDVRQEKLVERLEMVNKTVEYIEPFVGNIAVKKFFTEGDIYQRLSDAARSYEEYLETDADSVDGIIVQPAHWYRNNDTLKWKPPSQLTLDFKFFPAEQEDVDDELLPRITAENVANAFLLGVKAGPDIQLFRPKYPVLYGGDVILTPSELNAGQWANAIVECAWDFDRKMFLPIRIRDDRTHPNNLVPTAQDVWYDIHHPVHLTTLVGKDLVVMRKLHNKVKGDLLRRFLQRGNTIIDIGSGRGGDINKWSKLGLERIYAIEPDKENAAELVRRLSSAQIEYGTNMPDVELLNFGAQDTAAIQRRINDDKIDAIVSFFSLTFFGKDAKMWNALFKTLDLIKEGGYFIGGVMDGGRVNELLTKERTWQTYTAEDLFRQADELEKKAEKIENKTTRASMLTEVEHMRNEANLRQDEDYVPLHADEAVTYSCDAFSIDQMSKFDMTRPDGNEIEISIQDEASMVKNQIEWLINYDILRKRLNMMGFEEATWFFIDGPDQKFLPRDGYTFSSLNRMFCFRRNARQIIYKVPSHPGDIKIFRNDIGENMVLLGTRTENGGFIHAILQALDDNYREMTSRDQDEYVLTIRKGIARKLTKSKFQELHNGELAKRLIYQVRTEVNSEASALEFAFTKFKLRLVDPNFPVSEVSLLELLTDEFDVSIYVIDLQQQNKTLSLSKYSSNKVHCEKILNHANAVVVATEDDLKFYLAGRKNANGNVDYVFQQKDSMIKQMYDKLCATPQRDVEHGESTATTFVISALDDAAKTQNNCTNATNFQIKEFGSLKKRLAKTKGLYDKPAAQNEKKFRMIIRQFEHSNMFRQQVHDGYNTPNVSNAWLKAYELFVQYKVFPSSADNFVYFDNAAFPGSFILAAWHFVHTKCNIKNFQWFASSMLTDDERPKGPKGLLEDKYNLYKNYPENWLMDERNNGDVTSWENQLSFKDRLNETVDLYTSDLGFDVSSDFNRQEELQAHANMGQVLTGLLVLKRGGTSITKQYTYFEPFTVSLMGVLTRVFDKVEICKPMFSKPGNSETYLVCLGYIGVEAASEVIELLHDRLVKWNLKPLITKTCLSDAFLSSILRSQQHFANTQIERMTAAVSEYKRFVKSGRADRNHVNRTNKFAAKNKSDLVRWTKINDLERLSKHQQLHVKEVLRR